MFKTREGGGVKGRLNNVKKTALLARDGFPYLFVLFLVDFDNFDFLFHNFPTAALVPSD